MFFAILAGKTISLVIKVLGKTGATAAPGLYALKVDPELVRKLAAKIPQGSIVVSGTNGKTTTSRLATDLLSTKFKIIHNRQGSNLLRGIASTLIAKSSLFGEVEADLGLWEVDEATLPEAVENVNPKVICLLNLFRDQLDRYGEVDTVRAKWQKILSTLPKTVTLILNADDPGVSFLAMSFNGKVIFYGVEEGKIELPQVDFVADIKHCLNCGSFLSYTSLFTAHMGHYSCPKCDFRRPKTQVSASELKFRMDFSTSLKLALNRQLLTVNYQLPGLFNVYNILAASAIAQTYNLEASSIKSGIENFSAAFGRFQKIKIGDKNIIIFLIKNPAGANEVIRTIATKEDINLLAILNNRIADGRDVSWIWDTNWEILKDKIKSLSVAGIRSWDLATRLKYAEINLSKKDIYKNIYYSIRESLAKLSNNDTLIILPTYSALLDVQRSLNRLGGRGKWHKQ